MAQTTAPLMLDNTGQAVVNKLEGISSALLAEPTIATTAVSGLVKPDGDTITILPNGTISAVGGGTIIVETPVVSVNTFTYDGTVKEIQFSSIDLNNIIVTGNTSTDAGDKTCTCILKGGDTVWSDLTTGPKTFAWTINKATGSVSLSPTSATLSSSTPSASITLTIVGEESAIISSSNTSIVTVSTASMSTSGSFTVTGYATGSATVTVTLPESSNYTSASTSLSVTCSFTPIKTFAAATDDEIAQMVAAADAGEIDLYTDCGWRVGQEHTTTIAAIASSGSYGGVSWSVGESHSSQSVTFVLMHQGLYNLVTPVKSKGGASRSTCSFVVGLKDCLSTKGYMNSTSDNTGSWNSSARRGWCNGGFRRAIPSTLRSAFKQFTTTTGVYNGTTIGAANQTTQDYFCLAAVKEVFGSRSSSTLNEFNALTQFTYYATTSNRTKKVSGSTSGWWERSPTNNNSLRFCYVGATGAAPDGGANAELGLAPFGCL